MLSAFRSHFRPILSLLVFLLVFLSPGIVQALDVNSPLPTPEPTPTPDPGHILPPDTMPESFELEDWLIWLALDGIAAGWVVYEILERYGTSLTPKQKRVAGLFLPAILCCGAFVSAVLFGYLDAPVSNLAWFERIFSLAFASVVTASSLHGYHQLPPGNGKSPPLNYTG